METALLQIGVGVIGGVLTAGVLRFFGHVFDFVPRKLHNIGIGSSFEPFVARGLGDNYDDVLLFRIHNHSTAPLFIIRAVYIPSNKNMPIYENAIRSQKYRKGYEVKFGPQWKDMAYLLLPKDDTQSYVPLSKDYDINKFPQGKRGKLLIEYVHDGKSGVHRAEL